MKEMYILVREDGSYEQVEKSKASHMMIPVSTFFNMQRIMKERSCKERHLSPKKHSGYVVIKVEPFNETDSRVRVPNDKYGTWNVEKISEFEFKGKLEYLSERKRTNKIKVQCYLVDVQTPYDCSLSLDDLELIMLPELVNKVIPLMGYEGVSSLDPDATFEPEWKKEGNKYVLKKMVYKIRIVQNTNDKAGRWHVHLYTTAVPKIPREMM